MLVVALLLMALSTFDVSLGLMHSIEAFIFYTGPGGSAARFTGLTDWVNILKTCNVVFGKVISDGILIYRCWTICNRSIVIINISNTLVDGISRNYCLSYLARRQNQCLYGIQTQNHPYKGPTVSLAARSVEERIANVIRIIIESGLCTPPLLSSHSSPLWWEVTLSIQLQMRELSQCKRTTCGTTDIPIAQIQLCNEEDG
ncbi:hypothetical protein DFJ43DRAFT_1173308 [Lentinula guzmanii]|uniref:Secreted protein n=1 Tax=Lentinula guzmanii TaxID=2804957 RepID=A0AA38J112_9AGAR|nr:hypothetical protein DFJ43DRAFT_1173308 [Lentinula guzmanii]